MINRKKALTLARTLYFGINMELRNKQGQSIADYLLQIMPSLQLHLTKGKDAVDPLAARSLFAVWKNEENKIKDGVYRRPSTISGHQLEAMQKAGLARNNGSNIEITEKGANVIKVMVLGDNSSIFDKSDDRIIDYATALQNTKSASVRRGKGLQKKASSDWWSRFE
jgi:hypothetical protein